MNMVRKCNVYLCRSNYEWPKTPYIKMVTFPSKKNDPENYERWINALPNERASLLKLSSINVCVKHFPESCEWMKIPGGRRPVEPPSVFPGVLGSCLKQVKSSARSTKAATSDSRQRLSEKHHEDQDRIKSFDLFCTEVKKRYKHFNIVQKGCELYMSLMDDIGRRVIQFLHFRQVVSHFGFLHLVSVEKNGIEISKSKFSLQKNSLISRWTQFNDIFNVIRQHQASTMDFHTIVMETLKLMVDVHDLPLFQFLKTQFEMLLSPPKGRRFDKNLIVLAAELHNVSPAAYKFLRKSASIILPSTKMIKQMLSKTLSDDNFKALLEKLKPQQRLVNVLFDEVKLVQTMRFTAGHIVGFATNNESDDEMLATHALVVEIVCHFGGPRYILRVCPVSKLNSESLRKILLETTHAILKCGGTPVSFICDNCQTNQSVYTKLGGPGKVYLETVGIFVYLTYDYVHIFKNVRNNWITVTNKELSFTKDGKKLVAFWSDLVALYDEDKMSPLRLTKLTHTAIFPKPLQRQSVPLVSQVFNDKTVAALYSFKQKLGIRDGTIEFVSMINQWFKMMNVKDKYSAIHLRDEFRLPWTIGCDSFKRLHEICDVISSCTWKGGRNRVLKLTNQTGTAFTITTRTNMESATALLNEYEFEYVLPAVFSDDAIEKFFGQARQRKGGNFYIDSTDILAAAKVVNLHALLKYDLFPVATSEYKCLNCTQAVNEDHVEMINEFDIFQTQTLLSSSDSLKQKVVYIAGHLTHKYLTNDDDDDDDYAVSTEFLDNLNRGGLSLPKLSTTFFVHASLKAFENLNNDQKQCRNYIEKCFSFISTPLSSNTSACKTLANIILKAYVLDNSDREQEVGCLRRKEKLTV